MGFVHYGQAPSSADDIVRALPAFSDRDIESSTALAQGYAHLRSALTALSGVSLLRNLAITYPGELPGVVAASRDMLDEARAALAIAAHSARADLRLRAVALQAGVEALEYQVECITRDAFRDVDFWALKLVRGLLSDAAVPSVGMRSLTSVSCAGYYSAHAGQSPAGVHRHTHPHGNGHDH